MNLHYNSEKNVNKFAFSLVLHYLCTRFSEESTRDVVQLVVYLVWDQGVARSSRVIPTKRSDRDILRRFFLFYYTWTNNTDTRMADNYLEKKMEQYRAQAPRMARSKTMTLNQLLVRNRSHRGYDTRRIVTIEELRRIVNVNTRIPSARNRQCLRFRLVGADEAHKVNPLIRLGGALPELHLPFEGTEPQAFIVACSTLSEDKWIDMDLGISAQSMLLKATEMGLNGICIGAFDAKALTEALALPYTPLLVIAIGKGMEDIRLTEIAENESHTYYRIEGVHYVPKVRLDDLIITE